MYRRIVTRILKHMHLNAPILDSDCRIKFSLYSKKPFTPKPDNSRFTFLATERPRLQLKPRSIPKDEDISNDAKSPASSAIFGGAKPVDTATRDKEITARLEKENSEKESREPADGRGGDRRRFKSTGSEDGEKKFEKG